MTNTPSRHLTSALLAQALAGTFLALGAGTGCAGPGTPREPVAEAWGLRIPPNAAILDVRSEAEFAAGHLPGAVRIDAQRWKAASISADEGLDHAGTWHAIFGACGITGRDPILIYDDGRMTEAARVWFILQHMGAPEAAVINGGFPMISREAAAGRLRLVTQASAPRPVKFRPRDPGRVALIARDELKRRVARREVQVFDARSRAEYSGADLRQNQRGGHLPTATNLPHTELLRDGLLKPPAELIDLLAGAGFERGRPVITHCDGGGRASLAALAAQQAGYGPVLNYYLSFGDWAADASCPIEAETRTAAGAARTTGPASAPTP